MNALSYLIQVNIYLLLFYGLYLLMLRNETFFKMNRLYLVGSTLLAIIIPLLKAQWIKDLFVTENVYQVSQTVKNSLESVVNSTSPFSSTSAMTTMEIIPTHHSSLNAGDIFWIVYGCITMLLLLNFVRKLYLVNRAIKNGKQHQAFSFFKRIVVDKHLKGVETIINHEMVHVKQLHSVDVIFFELFTAFNWFNPITFAYKKAIKNIHEFIADETAAAKLDDKAEYALLLVSNAFGTNPQKLANNFYNSSLLKRRLIMLNKNKSRKVAILKYGLSVPLFAIMVIFSSATIEQSETIKKITVKLEENIPTVLDALSNGSIPRESENTVDKKKLPALQPNAIIIEKAENPNLSKVSDYVKRSIRYSPADQQVKREGMTYIAFELDDDGIVKGQSIVRAMSAGSYNEVYRVFKNAKPFGPGLKGKYILPINFSLSTANIKLPKHDYTKETIDAKKWKEYTLMDEVYIRGYLTPETIEESKRLEKLVEFFTKSVRWTAEDEKAGILGANFLAFELDSTGRIQNPSFAKVLTPSFEKEIMRVVNLAVPFGTGKEGNYILPVIFELGNTDLSTVYQSFGSNKYVNYNRITPLYRPAVLKLYDENGIKKGKQVYGYASGLPRQTFSYQTVDETQQASGKIVNYIKVNYEGVAKPIILVDGEVAEYTAAIEGFKLTNTIYPRMADIKIYTGDEAVKNYNESVRKTGLIVITTK